MLSRVGNLTDQSKPPAGMVVAGVGSVADSGHLHVPARERLRAGTLRRVCEHVLAHLEEDISNRVLAELVGLSTCYFVRAFKESAGVPPHQFVLHSRVDRVKRLLVETDLALAQIAVAAGFADQSHCTRRFRKLVGVTPGRFRRLRGWHRPTRRSA